MSRKILKASAGTGKTYRLSIEYIASLMKKESFENILVMTFTKKATAEIKERILEQLELIINNKPESDEILDNIKQLHPNINCDRNFLGKVYTDILKNKDKIKVFTIDSFTNMLFKKAIAPHLNIYNYEIISDEKNQEYIQQIFEKIINNKKFFEEIRHFFTDNAKKDIEEYFSIISSILNNRWKFLLINKKERHLKSGSDYFIELEEGISTLKEITKLKDKEDDFESFLSKDFQNYYCMDISSKKRFIENNYKLFFNSKALKFWNGRKTMGKNFEGLREKLDDHLLEFKRRLAVHVYNHFIIPFEQQIFDFANLLFDLYDTAKFFEKKFTHTDISTYTYKYFYEPSLNLVKDGKVTDYLYQLIGGKITTVFIDEFQDTSVLQWKILKPIIESELSSIENESSNTENSFSSKDSKTSITNNKISTNVICVGDSKQSIYGWRGGEKELFDKLENIIKNSENECMDISYRSQKNIIEFVNSFFYKTSDLWSYDPVNFLPSKNRGYVRTYIENKDDEISAIDKMIEILKNDITNYSGVGIVARTKKQLNIISECLNDSEIPFITNDGQCIVEHKAIKGIYSLIKFLAYNDFFYLLEFLRSDIINIDEISLKEMVIHSKNIENYLSYKIDTLPKEIFSNNKNESFNKKTLGFIKGILKKKPSNYVIKTESGARLDNLSKSLIEEFKLTDKFTSNSDRKNIFKFYELLRNFSDLHEFIRFIEENRNEELLKQVAMEELNAVKLMTIHKSKGLEFETEFLYWELSSRRPTDRNLKFYLELDEMYSHTKDYLLTSSEYNNVLDFLDIDFKTAESRKEYVEELNNLYVAITRPKNNLYFFLNTKTDSDKLNKKNDFILDALRKVYRTEDFTEISDQEIGEFEEKQNTFQSTQEINSIDNIKLWFDNSKLNPEIQNSLYNQKLNFDYKLSVHKENIRKRGLAVHYYLSFIKYGESSERELATKLTLAKYGNMFGSKNMAEIFKTVDTFIAKHTHIFNKDYKIFTEYEVWDTSSENEKKYIIDRIMIDDNRKIIHIYDYKTGHFDEKQLIKYQEIIKKNVGNEYTVKTGKDYFLQID